MGLYICLISVQLLAVGRVKSECGQGLGQRNPNVDAWSTYPKP